jgi:hypothetical protein
MNIDKPKMTRAELLAKARAAKAEKAKAKVIPKVEPEPEIELEPAPELEIVKPKAKTKAKVKATVEVKEIKKDVETLPEIVEEVVRVAGNRRKKIVKRTIELEDSGTDEEVIEEVVRVPKIKNEVKYSRDEMKKKLFEVNQQRLHNELFS